MQLAGDSPLKFGWVEDSRFVERTGNTVVVEFPPSLESKTKTLFWPQAVKKIEECLSSRLGTNIKLESRFNGEEPPAPPEPEPIPVSTSGFPAKPSSASPKSVAPSIQSAKAPEPIPPMISPEELKEFKNDPLIKKALEIFKAEILVSPPVAGA